MDEDDREIAEMERLLGISGKNKGERGVPPIDGSSLSTVTVCFLYIPSLCL
jgi:hypothetical protein